MSGENQPELPPELRSDENLTVQMPPVDPGNAPLSQEASAPQISKEASLEPTVVMDPQSGKPHIERGADGKPRPVTSEDTNAIGIRFAHVRELFNSGKIDRDAAQKQYESLAKEYGLELPNDITSVLGPKK